MDDLEAALTDIGYLRADKAAADINDLVTNYNLALYLERTVRVYSLSGNSEDPSDVDGVKTDRIMHNQSMPETLPGGGAAGWSLNFDSQGVTPEGYGADVYFAGITTDVLLECMPKRWEGTLLYGSAVSLDTSDEDADIYYTTDGGDPVSYGVLYEEPIPVTQQMTLTACTIAADGRYSPVNSWDYTVKTDVVNADIPSGRVEPGTEVTLCPAILRELRSAIRQTAAIRLRITALSAAEQSGLTRPDAKAVSIMQGKGRCAAGEIFEPSCTRQERESVTIMNRITVLPRLLR